MQNIIAIDGPSGSGKSTVARQLAKSLEFLYIDTGAMFRAVAYCLNDAGIDQSEDGQIQSFLDECTFSYNGSEDNLISINSNNLTTVIRNHEVSSLASIYSKNSIIRDYLKKQQQILGESNTCVMEGRDIGTVVFPKARLKIFLTASNSVRAKRRFQELEKKGTLGSLTEESILADIIERDERDSKRDVAPLIQADDAIKVITDDYTIEEVVQKIIILANERFS